MTEVINMLSIMFLIFEFLFHFYLVMLRQVRMICADIGPAHPARASPIERKVAFIYMVVHLSEEDEELRDIEENMQLLTVGIPNVSIDDLPRHYQCHTVGVSGQFVRLLHRVE